MCSSARAAFSELAMTRTMMVDWRAMPSMPTRTGGLAIGDVVSDQGQERSSLIRKANGSWDVLSYKWLDLVGV